MEGIIVSEFRAMSFYIGYELQCAIIKLFFCTNSGEWNYITIGDGYVDIGKEKNDPVVCCIDDIDDDFAYPVRKMDILDKYTSIPISSVKEYRLLKNPLLSIGLYIEFGTKGFSLVEDDMCLFVYDGIYDKAMDSSFFHKFKLTK